MSAYEKFDSISPRWINLQTIIEVKRTIDFPQHPEKSRNETAYFISSLPVTTAAEIFNIGIRSHWLIENSLHYVKDVTFGEDNSRVRTKQAPENISIMVNMVLNIFRKYQYENIAQAIRFVAHDIPKLWEMIRA